jgi:GntR family transcriptional regulator, rspAB operon transcriptional repressor
MTDVIDPNPSSQMGGSFRNFSGGRKTHENKRVIADTVYARLRDAILSAELRPNRRLVEDELADWLNISRTPIRESLLRLEQEGLVERDRGWVVREHNLAEIQARLECRLAIEGYAARLAAERRSEADLQQLSALADAMEIPGLTRLEFNRLNDQFHKIITEAAHNATLVSLHSQTKMNYWDLNVPVVFGPEDDRKIHRHHRALIAALTAQDGDQAESILRGHIQLTIEVVVAALKLEDQS